MWNVKLKNDLHRSYLVYFFFATNAFRFEDCSQHLHLSRLKAYEAKKKENQINGTSFLCNILVFYSWNAVYDPDWCKVYFVCIPKIPVTNNSLLHLNNVFAIRFLILECRAIFSCCLRISGLFSSFRFILTPWIFYFHRFFRNISRCLSYGFHSRAPYS